MLMRPVILKDKQFKRNKLGPLLQPVLGLKLLNRDELCPTHKSYVPKLNISVAVVKDYLALLKLQKFPKTLKYFPRGYLPSAVRSKRYTLTSKYSKARRRRFRFRFRRYRPLRLSKKSQRKVATKLRHKKSQNLKRSRKLF